MKALPTCELGMASYYKLVNMVNTSNLYLQLQWSNLTGTANAEVMMMRHWQGGRDLIINFFFPKDVYRCSLFFFLVLHARSRVLANVLQKNKKRNKTTSVYRLTIFWANSLYILDLRQLEIDLISLYKAPQFSQWSKALVNQTFLISPTSRVSPHTKLYFPGSPQGIADDRCICHWINHYPVDKC